MKKFFFVFSCTFIIIFIFCLFLTYSEGRFAFSLKKHVPTNIKNFLKDNLFSYFIIIRDYEKNKNYYNSLKKKLTISENKYDALQSKVKSGKVFEKKINDSQENEYFLKKIFLDYSISFDENRLHKKNGYLDIFQDQVIIVFWTGKIIYLNKSELEKSNNIKFQLLQSNIRNYLQYDEDDKFISVKDILIKNNSLYLSYVKVINPENNCSNISIVRSELKFSDKFKKLQPLQFKEFFTYKECLTARFGGYQAGGRIVSYKNNEILLTTGEFQNFTPSQDKSSMFGKIIAINNSGQFRLLSMGHRNPQGLLFDEKNNLILSTEHGQRGGDEINNIYDNGTKTLNYGWPISSYSDYYGYENYEIRKKAPFKKSHEKYGFIEPLIYFTPALGISQIISTDNLKTINSDKIYLVSSLAKKKLVYIKLNEKNTVAKKINELYLGERIRDIIKYGNNKFLLYLEDTPALSILEIKEKSN